MRQPMPSPFVATIRDYARQIRTDWQKTIPALILPGLSQLFSVYVPPLVVASMITRFNDKPQELIIDNTLPYLALFAGAWLFGQLLWRFAMYYVCLAEFAGVAALDKRAFSTLLRHDLTFFHDNFAGSLTKKLLGYSRRYENVFDTLAFTIFASILPLIFACVILAGYAWYLPVVLIGMMSITFYAILPFIKKRMELVRIREAANNVMAGHVADVVSNIDAVHMYARQADEERHHEVYMHDFLTKQRRSWDYQNVSVEPITSVLFVITNLLGLWIATTLGQSGIEIATIFVIFTYFANATNIVWEFTKVYRGMEGSLSEAAQYREVMDTPVSIKDPLKPTTRMIQNGVIDFVDVDFTYHDEASDKDKLFAHFNLSIGSREKIALVGHSGGGKTTVTKLLLRFMDTTKGDITIDGMSITQLKLNTLREAIAYVPQEPIMFHRSLMENIRYGRPGASEDEVISAAKKAHAHDFISRLPEKYDTLVGERGIKLSGGQRQRIAIARAILKDAPIIVLDEATSALDSESEKHIQAALTELMKQRTAIVIAHRLSTIQRMDRIVVLEEGSIVEQGTHQSLIQAKGTYASLWAHQSGGFIEE